MIRLAPWEAATSELVALPPPRAGAKVLERLTARTHGAWFWATLWAVSAAASLVVLWPVFADTEQPVPSSQVMFRLVGVTFVACGLVAWRRRPDSDVGRLMTAVGFGVFVYPIASQIGSPFVVTMGTLFSSVWIVAFYWLILGFVTGGRLETTVDRVLVAASFVAMFVLQFAVILFADYPDNVLLLVHGHLDVFATLDDVQSAILVAVSVAVAVVVATRWREASPPRRRAMLPSVAGVFCMPGYSGLLLSWVVARTTPEWLMWGPTPRC